MKEKNNKCSGHKDVIQRYCPGRGENVVMLRTYDDGCHLECMNYDNCRLEKDKLCGNGKPDEAPSGQEAVPISEI